MPKDIFLDLVHQLPKLDQKLMALLKNLTPEEWQAQTIAKLWKVKDVAAHLLDGNIRLLSILRDDYMGDPPEDVHTYSKLVAYLNRLNADWVQAMKRVSPQMLVALHELTGKPYYDYYASLDPLGKSKFPVDWAGEEESKNWMHIAREYTEKFLHQQQIRDAVNKPGIMHQEFFLPFAEVCLLAWPHTFREVEAKEGTTIKLHIPGGWKDNWYLTKQNQGWSLDKSTFQHLTTDIVIEANDFWKLVSKSWRYDDVKERVQIIGDQNLAHKTLSMVSFMA
ncbi:maleylpyruvate isomerase N-terminal domain-containing protein [uncultured Microscilla sp.]|uniref:maleylpyruvate isomerase N-terminal domain-containing protein n=1 Tax=uncultured Microscilla sp. TaxID=432653 RepID=UPI00262C8937|nr:maleylpyruvate isomerase N-terminal domain-containing protein [uncultured Microscilla sp.]